AAVRNSSDPFKKDILQGMSESLRGWGKAKPFPAWNTLKSEVTRDPDLQKYFRLLGLAFGDSDAAEYFRSIGLNEGIEAKARQTAVRTLIDYRVPDLLPLLEKLLASRSLAAMAAQGMMAYDDPAIPRRIVDRYSEFPIQEKSAVIASLASRATGAEALLDAMGEGKIDRQTLSPYHARQIRSLRNEKLNQKLSRIWGDIRPTAPDKVRLIKSYKASLAPERLKSADLATGRELFNQACALRHTLYGEGAKIGPDLTGSGR